MSQFNRISNVDAPGKADHVSRTMAPMWGSDGNPVTAISPEHTLMPFAAVSNKPVPQFQNGRVIGISDVKGGSQFKMFTENNNKCDNAKETILYGTLTRSPLSDTFFSKTNMKCLQNMLRYQVYVASGGEYQIGEQDNTSLQVIMRAMYLQYAKHLPYNIKDQVLELNRQVVEFSLPKIMSEIKQYIHYVRQLETLPNPIELPRNLSVKGTRTLASVTSTF
jgi:hypothetical protein